MIATLRRPLVVFAAALIGAAVTGSACTSAPAPPPTAEPLTRVSITALTQTDPFTPADAFNRPAVGTRYVAVQIAIKANEKLTVAPARWIRAETRSGSLLNAAVVASQPGDISAGGENLGRMAAGETLSGLLIYEVPLGDLIVALLYHDDLVPPQRERIPLP